MRLGRKLAAVAMIGAGLGAAGAFSPGGLFIGSLAAAVSWLLFRFASSTDRRFLVRLFLAGFLIRAFLSMALDLGSCFVERGAPSLHGPADEWDLGVSDKTRGYLRMGDSDYYSQRAYATAQYLRGKRESVVVFRLNQYGWNGYVDLMGLFYYLFGFSPGAVKGINWLLGAGMGLIVFWILKGRFHPAIGRWAAVGVAFFPSLILWSVSNLKDTTLIFLTLLSVLLYVRWEEARGWGPRFWFAACLGLTLALHATVRDSLFVLLAGAFAVSALLTRPWIRGWVVLLLLGVLAGAGAALAFREPAGSLIRLTLSSFFHKHIGYVSAPGLSYAFLPPQFYVGKYNSEWVASGVVNGTILSGMARAVVHFFVEPLPGRFDRPIHLVGLAQMSLWYGMLMLALAGIASGLRRGWRRVFPLILPFGLLSVVMALTSGNVGTLFRVRDLISPFLIVFACAGGWVLFRNHFQGSLLLKWLSGVRGKAARRLAPLVLLARDRAVRRLADSLEGRWGIFLASAVAMNVLLTGLLQRLWSPWSAGFRLGLLALALWGFRVSSDLKTLTQESRLIHRIKRLQWRARP